VIEGFDSILGKSRFDGRDDRPVRIP
jgi:hypothetical protein